MKLTTILLIGVILASLAGFIYLIIWLCSSNKKTPTNSNNINYDDKIWDMNFLQTLDQYRKKNKKYNFFQEINPLRNTKILYINLDRSPKRNEFMLEQFNTLDLDYTRISGVDGKKMVSTYEDDVDDVSFTNYHDLNSKTKISKSEIGCTLSHIKAIRHAYNNHLDNVLIMEDDCILYLTPFWGIDMDYIITNAPSDWGIIQLHVFKDYCVNKEELFGKHNVEKPCYSTAVYLINRKGMTDILNKSGYDHVELGKTDIRSTADQLIYSLTNTYYLTVPLFLTADEMHISEIHPSHQSGHVSVSHNIIKRYNEHNSYRLKRYNDIDFQFMMAEVLFDLDDFMKRINMKYFLFCGTALGAYREGKIISYDQDIDIGVFSKDFNDEVLKGNENFSVKSTYGVINNGYELTLIHNSGMKVDIFIVYTEGDYNWHASYTGKCNHAKNKMCRWKLPKFDIEDIELFGNVFKIPNPIEKYLEAHYGPNWNIPKQYTYSEGLMYNLQPSLIQDDFPKEKRVEPRKEKQKYNIWPRKIKEMDKPIIWMYWQNKNNQSRKPDYLNLCLESVKKHCEPEFNIILLDDDKFEAISRNKHKNFRNIEPIAMRADYIRFCIISEYGGIWLDHDIVVLRNLNKLIQDLNKYNFVGFTHDNDKSELSIGIFAGKPNNKICNEFLRIFEKHPDYSEWINKKSNMKWAGPTHFMEKYLKEVSRLYPLEFKSYEAKNTIYPIHWKKSKDYYWSNGRMDDHVLNDFLAVYLHNNMYKDEHKNLSKEQVLNGEYRISHLFRKALGRL